MTGSACRRPRPGARGAITWVTAVLLLGLCAAGYLASVWVPVYILHYEVKAVVRDYANRAIKNPADADLVGEMCARLRSLDRVTAPGEDGELVSRPAADVHPRDVVWERDGNASPPALRVAFEYRRDVHYPILDRWEEKTMRVDLSLDISRADWGSAK